MVAFRVLISGLTLGTSLSACFQLPTQSVGQVTVLDGSARSVNTQVVSEGKASATIDADSKSPQLLAAPASGNLSGSSITIQPGSLAISADILVEEAIPLSETSLFSELRLTDDVSVQNVGSGLIVRPSQGVDLAHPLTINMPIPVASGLRLQNSQNIAVFYKQFGNEGLTSGIIPGHKILLKGDGTVSFEGYFGAYWVALMNKPVTEEKIVKSEEPIVNTQRISVIETAGVVTETAIVAKALIPEVSWASSELKLEADSRTVYLKAAVKDAAPLSACKADLFQTPLDKSGLLFELGSQTQMRYVVVKPEAHTLIGRFRCQDSQGRMTSSPWSPLINIPALRIVAPPVAWAAVDLSLDQTTRVFSLLAKTVNSRSLKDCVALFKPSTAGVLPISVQTGSNLIARYEHSAPSGETFDARFQCRDEEGRLSESPWSIAITVAAKEIALPIVGGIVGPGPGGIGGSVATMSWAPTSLILNADRSVSLQAYPNSTENFQSCSAEFAQDPNASFPISIAVGVSVQKNFTPSLSSQHPLYGRIVCQMKSGSVQNSPWSEPVTVPAAGPSYCGISAPPLAIYGNRGLGAPLFYDYFQHVASTCAYEMDVFVDANVNVVIASPEQNLVCGSTNNASVADGQSFQLSCASENISSFSQKYFSIPRGNYRARLDFAANTQSPSLVLQKISCPSGDLFLRMDSGAMQSMEHLGACEFEKTGLSVSGYGTMKITNASETRFCAIDGSPSYLFSDMDSYGSCSAPPREISHYLTSGNYNLHLRSGLSADPSGMNPNRMEIWASKEAACPPNYHLLTGSSSSMTAANAFVFHDVSDGRCRYTYDWMSGPVAPFNFKIGTAPATICGTSDMPSSSGSSASWYIGCGTSPFQWGEIQANHAYFLELFVNPTDGSLSELKINDAKPDCRNSIYLQPEAERGIFLDGSRMMFQKEEYLYEYQWTPNANTGFQLVSKDGSEMKVCGLSAGSPDVVVGGSTGVYLRCENSRGQIPRPIQPVGISLNSPYKIQLDYRMASFDNPPVLKVSAVASQTPCSDEFYVTGGDFGSNLGSNNMFQQRSGCNFEFTYLSNSTYPTLQIVNSNANINCGLSQNNIANNGTYALDCGSNQSPSMFSFTSSNSYRMSITQQSGGGRIFKVEQLSPCSSGMYFDGPAATSLSPASTYLNYISNCVHQITWTPSSSSMQSFFLRSSDGTYCGAGLSGTLPSDGNFYNAICNVTDPSKLHNFSPNVTGGQTYRITFDQQRADIPPQVKMELIPTAASIYGLSFQKGSTTSNSSGSYGNLNSPDLNSSPGARSFAAKWTDSNGRLWLFGGTGRDANGTSGNLNDLWVYEPQNNTWTWKGGSQAVDSNGNVGVLNFPDSNNMPSARWGATTWIAGSTLWLLGGHGLDSIGAEGKLNDLWSYNLLNSTWTWEGGSAFKDSVGIYTGPILDPRSRVGGAAWVEGGYLWLYGGEGTQGFLSDLWKFDFTNKTWALVSGDASANLSKTANSPGGLAFPSTWNNGDVYLYGGSSFAGHQGTLWRFSAGTWQELKSNSGSSNYGILGAMNTNNAPSPREKASSWMDNQGRMWLFGGFGIDSVGATNDLADVWIYIPGDGNWMWAGGTQNSNLSSDYNNGSYMIGARRGASAWFSSSGNDAFIFGGSGYSGSGFLGDLWRIDPIGP